MSLLRLGAALALLSACTSGPRFSAPECVAACGTKRGVRVDWAEAWGDTELRGITIGGGATVVVGTTSDPSSSALVARYSEDATLEWSVRIAAPAPEKVRGMAVTTTARGGAIVLSRVDGKLGHESMVLTSISSDGGISWQRSFPGAPGSLASSAKSLVFTGTFEGQALELDGQRIKAFELDPPTEGGYQPREPTQFLAAGTPEGNVLWVRRIRRGRVAPRVAFTTTGELALAGSTERIVHRERTSVTVVSEGFVERRSPAGELLFSQKLTSTKGMTIHAVTVGPLGATFVTGEFEGTLEGPERVESAGHSDAIAVKLSPKGDVVWARRFGGAGWDAGSCIAIGRDEHVLVGGYWDEVPRGAVRRTAPFVAELDGNGKVISAQRFGFRPALSFLRDAAVDGRGRLVVAGSLVPTSPRKEPSRGFVAWLESF